MVNFPQVGEQSLEIEVSETSFLKDLAPARTFGYQAELESLKNKGLALGASVNNALAIGNDGYLNEPRFKDETVRHKILDVIGDLALIGKRINGFIRCKKSGHALNIKLAKAILKENLS